MFPLCASCLRPSKRRYCLWQRPCCSDGQHVRFSVALLRRRAAIHHKIHHYHSAARQHGDLGSDARAQRQHAVITPNLLVHYFYLWETTVVWQAIETVWTSASSGENSSSNWCQQLHLLRARPRLCMWTA